MIRLHKGENMKIKQLLRLSDESLSDTDRSSINSVGFFYFGVLVGFCDRYRKRDGLCEKCPFYNGSCCLFSEEFPPYTWPDLEVEHFVGLIECGTIFRKM